MRVSSVVLLSGTAFILPAGSRSSYRSNLTQHLVQALDVQASETGMAGRINGAHDIDICAGLIGRTPANFAHSRHLGWCHRFHRDPAECDKHFVTSVEKPGRVALCQYNNMGGCSLGSWSYCFSNSSNALDNSPFEVHGGSHGKRTATMHTESGNVSVGSLESTIKLLTRFEDETKEERRANYASERGQQRGCEATKSRFQSIVLLSRVQISEFISAKRTNALTKTLNAGVSQARALFLDASFMAQASANAFLSTGKELHAASLSLQAIRSRYNSIRNVIMQLIAAVRDHKQNGIEAGNPRGWWLNVSSASTIDRQRTSTLLDLTTKVKLGLTADPFLFDAPVSTAPVLPPSLTLASHFMSLDDTTASGTGMATQSHEHLPRYGTAWHAEVIDLCDSTLSSIANTVALRTKPLKLKVSRLQQQAVEDRESMHRAIYAKTAAARALVGAKRAKFAVQNRAAISGRNRAVLVKIAVGAHAGLSDAKFRCLSGHFDWQTIDTANRESLRTIENFVELLRGQKHVEDQKLFASVFKMS